MTASLFSQNWYKVRDLRPRLRRHVELHHHVYRGRDWYVLQDRVSGKFHRFDDATCLAIGQMNGQRTVEAIWKSLYESLGDDAPTQDEFINLLGALYQADALVGDVIPDIERMDETRNKLRSARIKGYMKSPIAIKLPLFDPDRFLERTRWLAALFFNRFVLVAWLALVVSALALAGQHWEALTGNFADQVFVLKNVVLMMLIYPVVKAVHEFSHAYAIKRWGGEVHEMGIIFLIFMPIPYVDASASHALRSKYRRALIAAAGIFAEMGIAALAVHLWVDLEPGLARSLAYNTILIAGVSTLFFNGNPLLRFDAYYILSDLVEIPNLASRGGRYIGYLCQRYLVGVEHVESPGHGRGERAWLFCYAIAAFCYRMFIATVIILFLATKFFFLGVLLACWSAWQLLGAPLYRIAKYCVEREVFMRRKRRGLLLATLLAGLVALVALMPLPLATVTEGVVWNPTSNRIYAQTDGFVDTLLVEPGQRVADGQPILRMRNAEKRTELAQLDGQLREVAYRTRKSLVENLAHRGIYEEQLAQLETEHRQLERELARLELTAPRAGRVELSEGEALLGRFVRKGQYLGHVIPGGLRTVMAVVEQQDLDYIRNSTRRVDVMLASDLDRRIPARAVRLVPSASREMPSAVLSVDGGGPIVPDPQSENRSKSLATLYWIEIEAAEPLGERIDERVYVRFEHQPVSLSALLYRKLRQTFIKRFRV